MPRLQRETFAAILLLCLSAQYSLPSCQGQNQATSLFQRDDHASASWDASLEIATIDTNTRWAFRALSPVTVSSPIIRLEDVAVPLDPNMAGWQRLKRSPIGLMPLDGQPMTIQRSRLMSAMRDAEATPLAIDWIGPSSIRVIYQPRAPASPDPRIRQSGYHPEANRGIPAVVPTTHASTLTEGDANRILHWIQLAIERQLPSIDEYHDIKISRHQAGLSPLQPAAGITEIRPLGRIQEGQVRFRVLARSAEGPVETELFAELTKHPLFLVPRSNLPRGHRISASDLKTKPIPDHETNSAFLSDAQVLIGKETRQNLRRDQPIRRLDVGAPILIHRGDLVEIQILGGGVKVSTNAKAVGEGAESDLIEVDTLRPRKRLVARVVAPGIVTIITRPPTVR